jgi:hypothetical protein
LYCISFFSKYYIDKERVRDALINVFTTKINDTITILNKFPFNYEEEIANLTPIEILDIDIQSLDGRLKEALLRISALEKDVSTIKITVEEMSKKYVFDDAANWPDDFKLVIQGVSLFFCFFHFFLFVYSKKFVIINKLSSFTYRAIILLQEELTLLKSEQIQSI